MNRKLKEALEFWEMAKDKKVFNYLRPWIDPLIEAVKAAEKEREDD